MKQRVRIRVEVCFATLIAYAGGLVLLYIFCWSGELGLGCMAGSFLARLIYAWKAGFAK